MSLAPFSPAMPSWLRVVWSRRRYTSRCWSAVEVSCFSPNTLWMVYRFRSFSSCWLTLRMTWRTSMRLMGLLMKKSTPAR